MQSTLRFAVLPACGLALATKPQGHFMALAQMHTRDPAAPKPAEPWGGAGGNGCSPDGYTGPSAAEYRKLSADIDADCKGKADELARKHEAYLKELEDDCMRQKRILAGKEEDHAEEKADVEKQQKVVAKEKMDVKEARVKVKELAHCPPELAQAREELATQEAIPNESSSDIDAECDAKKLVMEKEQCVEELRAAESVLSGHKDEHSEEKVNLGGEKNEKDSAAAELPPQEKRVEEACKLWDDAKKKGPPSDAADELNRRCKAKKDGLSKRADAAVQSLLDEYLRQKKILEGQEADHADEKTDVEEQEPEVAQEKRHVKDAKADAKKYAHCPPELEKAREELASQVAIPNETPADIDAECVAEKAVWEAEQCVDLLRKAEAVVATEKVEHAEEKSDLHEEQGEEANAAAKVPPQEKIVCELKAALDAARAAKSALSDSQVEAAESGADKTEPEKAQADKTDPEKAEVDKTEKSQKSEAETDKPSAAARSSVGLVAVAALLLTFLRA